MADKSAAAKFQAFQSAAQNAAVTALQNSPETLQKLIATSEQHFPSTATISAVQQQYQAIGLDSPNTTLENAIAATMECIDVVMTTSATFQYYVTLTVPKIEDGGNFGVSIQLETLKNQSEFSEKLVKHMEELTKYQSSRADALEKCKLPSSSSTKSTTKSASEGASTGGEKEGKTTNQSTATEEKTVETVTTATALESSTRKAAVVAVDVLYFSKAKVAFQQLLLGYMTICNFMDKNAEKIAKPRDTSSARGGYSAMY